MTTNVEDIIVFSWGFHDATHDKSRGVNRINAKDTKGKVNPLPKESKYQSYRIGYAFGQAWDITNGSPGTSEEAWELYKGI